MLPVIAIVGRPNVGKSTLFNQLTKSREAFDAIFEKEEIRHHTFLVRNYLIVLFFDFPSVGAK